MNLKLTASLLLSLFVVGCGGGGGESSIGTPAENNQDATTKDPDSAGCPNENPDNNDGGTDNINNDILAITKHMPAANSLNQPLNTAVKVQFTTAIDAVDAEPYIDIANAGSTIDINIKQVNEYELSIIPSSPLSISTVYTVTIDGSLTAKNGKTLNTTQRWRFTTTQEAQQPSPPVSEPSECMNDMDREMLAAVNKARSQARTCGDTFKEAVPPLSYNCKLKEAAQGHSDDMAAKDYFDHRSLDGLSPGDRIKATGLVHSGWSENIAVGQRTVEEVMEGWLDSPGHCQGIMSGSVNAFGMGYAASQNPSYRGGYWTQNFARVQN